MNKIFCTRCGKEITGNEISIKCETTVVCITLGDLCMDCWVDFREMLQEFLQKPVDSTEKK